VNSHELVVRHWLLYGGFLITIKVEDLQEDRYVEDFVVSM